MKKSATFSTVWREKKCENVYEVRMLSFIQPHLQHNVLIPSDTMELNTSSINELKSTWLNKYVQEIWSDKDRQNCKPIFSFLTPDLSSLQVGIKQLCD